MAMDSISAFQATDIAGTYTAARDLKASDIIAMAKRLLAEKFERGRELSSPTDSRDFLISELAELEHEVFGCMFLDHKHRLLAFEHLFRGTIDSASVHPREVVKQALAHNAAAVILTHNHPSGIPEPSQSDRNITRQLRDALALVDIRVLDHIVVGGAETVSFAERGLL